jgi:hypothetical protein
MPADKTPQARDFLGTADLFGTAVFPSRSWGERVARQNATSPMLTEQEALDLTERINRKTDELCWLLKQAHDEQAWLALGYVTFRAYVKDRLRISEQHAFRLLAQAVVIRRLADAAGLPAPDATNPWVSPPVPERRARAIKPILVEVCARVRARVADGAEGEQAIADELAPHARAERVVDEVAAHYDPFRKVSRLLDRAIAMAGDDAYRLAFQQHAAKVDELRGALDRALALQAAHSVRRAITGKVRRRAPTTEP